MACEQIELDHFDYVGIAVNSKERLIIESLAKKYYPNEKYELKTSSGSSIIIFPTETNTVVQYYLNEKTCQNIKNMYVSGLIPKDVFVDIIEFDEEYPAVVFEKIVPIITEDNLRGLTQCEQSTLVNDLSKKSIVQLISQMKENITILIRNQLSHGDCTMDNVGYSKNRNRFVLYDFDTLKINTVSRDLDLKSFYNSAKFHMVRM